MFKMNEQFCIEEYVSEKNLCEVSCIMKRLYSDFIVIEIPTLGSVLQPVCDDRKKTNNENEASEIKRLKIDKLTNDELGF